MCAAHCHAIRVRLTGSPDPRPVAERLATVTDSRLWVEEVAAASSTPAARRRRAAETARATDDVRCVLLRYADGVADLVIVAHRGAYGPAGLQRLAAAAVNAVGTVGADPGPADDEPLGIRPPIVAPAPDWGLTDGRDSGSAGLHLPLADAEVGDPVSWLAALAVVQHRYETECTGDGDVVGTARGTFAVPVDATLAQVRKTAPELVERPVLAGFLEAVDGVDGVEEYVPCLAPPFPVTLSVVPVPGGGHSLRCDYRLSHVAPAIAAQFSDHVRRVHRQILAEPALPFADVELLDPAEQAAVVALGRPAAEPVPEPVALHEAFRRVAEAAPDTIALCDPDVRLTYRELDELSGRLAAGLRARGVGPGDFVGVCLERSAELVVTLLGILKAGAAYAPTDPAYPLDRLAYTAQDAGVRVVVTRLAEFPAEDGVSSLSPDDLMAESVSAVSTDPAAPAYVIYTSGSTGRPKGVLVPHRNVLALIEATRDEYGLGPGDVWSLFHSSAFDFSVWEIWGCLLTGGRLVVVPYFTSREPDHFRELLAAEEVTVLSQTPSAFTQLLDAEDRGGAPGGLAVRLVVFGGEPLDARILLRWFDRYPETSCRVVNMFGITETTVHVTAQTMSRRLALESSRSVGPALPGWHLYVLDAAGRLLPPGVAGEIHVGGAGVAAGYLNRDELTARRFVPDPFAGGRMYRSGDLGRLRPDGSLDHLGRIDSQVKIRGFRIELDEIRAVLLEDPVVRSAAVVVRRDDPGDAATARLDAYVVLDGAGGPAVTADIRRRASGILPDYMVPATVTALHSLPLTSNGKLDAGALPVPTPPVAAATAAAGSGSAVGDGGLDGDLADVLRRVWGEVLGAPVGLDDDFFDLGGNSLLAVRIRTATRARGLPTLQLRDLYRTRTVRAAVAHLATVTAD